MISTSGMSLVYCSTSPPTAEERQGAKPPAVRRATLEIFGDVNRFPILRVVQSRSAPYRSAPWEGVTLGVWPSFHPRTMIPRQVPPVTLGIGLRTRSTPPFPEARPNTSTTPSPARATTP